MGPGDEEQELPTVSLGGVEHERVHVGEERPPGDSPCPGCGAYYGALHASDCEYEQCPVCGGQLASCACR
ncbi:MAG TPA: hypothetical protein VGL81_01735 [Polyangiaceae bacterium]|jgi:hypothetical protein